MTPSTPPPRSWANYATDILPFVFMMSFGMGFVFVPLTLTAVHGVAPEDSGIGSGVLNTMQQVGGALGLATLSTVFAQVATSRGDELAAAGEAAMQKAVEAGAPLPSDKEISILQEIARWQVFTDAATTSFVVGAGLMLLGSIIVWVFLDVKHEELATDGADAPIHVG